MQTGAVRVGLLVVEVAWQHAVLVREAELDDTCKHKKTHLTARSNTSEFIYWTSSSSTAIQSPERTGSDQKLDRVFQQTMCLKKCTQLSFN